MVSPPEPRQGMVRLSVVNVDADPLDGFQSYDVSVMIALDFEGWNLVARLAGMMAAHAQGLEP